MASKDISEIHNISCAILQKLTVTRPASDIALDPATVQEFFKTYYAPNNATLVVTGDFDPAEVKRLVQQYFGDIARVDAPPPVQCEQPFSPGEQRRKVTDAKATLPASFTIWRIPPVNHADTPALAFLATIYPSWRASRVNPAEALRYE